MTALPEKSVKASRFFQTAAVIAVLRQGMRNTSIKAWMIGSNPRLHGTAPIEAMHEGRAYEVMRAAKTFVTHRYRSEPGRLGHDAWSSIAGSVGLGAACPARL